jgi:hypothetical protein
MTSPTDLATWAREQAADVRRQAASRREMAQAYREGSQRDWDAARRLVEKQTGRPVPLSTPESRARDATMYEQLATKYEGNARRYEAIAILLDSLVVRRGPELSPAAIALGDVEGAKR